MPIGRVIRNSISESKKVASLKTDGARLLYTWLITHLDINGCFSGDPRVVNGKVFTRLNKSIKVVEDYLLDLEQNNLIIRYETNGDTFLNVPDFVEKQPTLRPERESKSSIPPPTSKLRRNSGVTPDELLSNSRQTPAHIKLSKVNLSKETKGKKETSLLSRSVKEVFEYWKERLNHSDAKFSTERKAKIAARLKESFHIESLKKAIDGCAASPYHMGENEQNKVYDGIGLIFRNAEKVEFFMGLAETRKGKTHDYRPE